MRTICKKTLILLLCITTLLCLFSGCQNEQDDFYDALMSAKPSADDVSGGVHGSGAPTLPPSSLSGTLRIGGGYFLDKLADGFMQLHPDVKIELDTNYSEAPFQSAEEMTAEANSFTLRMLTGLMAGDAPDVIEANTFNYVSSPVIKCRKVAIKKCMFLAVRDDI